MKNLENSKIEHGLVIARPFIDWILAGKKTWEIRGTRTKFPRRIALIAKGTGTVVGVCDLVGVAGPLTLAEQKRNAKKLNQKPSELTSLYYGEHTFAWVIRKARRLPKPVPYKHPSGAVIWVRLSPAIQRRLDPLRTPKSA